MSSSWALQRALSSLASAARRRSASSRLTARRSWPRCRHLRRSAVLIHAWTRLQLLQRSPRSGSNHARIHRGWKTLTGFMNRQCAQYASSDLGVNQASGAWRASRTSGDRRAASASLAICVSGRTGSSHQPGAPSAWPGSPVRSSSLPPVYGSDRRCARPSRPKAPPDTVEEHPATGADQVRCAATCWRWLMEIRSDWSRMANSAAAFSSARSPR